LSGSIKKQSLYSTLISLAGVCVGVLTQGFVFLKYFEINQVGLISILLSWSFILSNISNLGFNNAGTRFFYFFRENQSKGYLFLGMKWSAIGFLIASLLFYFLKNFLIGKQNPENQHLLNTYYYLIFLLALSQLIFSIFENYAKAHSKTIESNFLSQFLLRFSNLFVACLFVFKLINFPTFLYLFVASFWLQAILMIYACSKFSKLDFSHINLGKSPIQKDFNSFARFNFFTGISGLLILQIDKILVNKYLGLFQSGIYSFCILYASVLATGLIMVQKAGSSVVLDFLNQNDFKKINDIYKKSSYYLFNFGLFLFLLTFANIDDFFTLIKPAYSHSKYVLFIFGVAKIFDLLTGINSLIISNSKLFKIDSYLTVFYLLLMILLNHFFIQKWGIHGAALAFLVASLLYNSIRSFLLYKHFQLQPFTLIHLKILFLFCIVSVTYFLLKDFSFGFWGTIFFRNGIIVTMYISLNLLLKTVPDLNFRFKDEI
jgi:O-antigen/teichoic acid export membrane protein